MFLIIAAIFRFFAAFALGFWSSTYFTLVYPEYTDAYSVLNAVTIVFFGSFSAFMGGYLGD